MGKLIFILGGTRSGKSTYAVELAKRLGRKVAFIATCLPVDEEMKRRIRLHRQFRPAHWKTFELPQETTALVEQIGPKFDTVLIDCLTILISNLLLTGLEDDVIENKVNKMFKALKSLKCRLIVVANEVGLGIVPENLLARRFRDLAGRISQAVAQRADEVFFMTAGLPLKIKGK